MIRRLFVLVIALYVCGSVVHAQAERASFILTSGERISGTLVFHGSNRENLIDNDFSLAVTPGQPEQIFHYAQVAVIDFIGGTPRTAELKALPDNGHLLIMRNGDTTRGHFVNIIGGDTIKSTRGGAHAGRPADRCADECVVGGHGHHGATRTAIPYRRIG
jgi:hypothetical protein